MSCRDRTSEFNQLAEQIRKRDPSIAKNSVSCRPAPERSTFSVQSGEIKKYLNATTSKLERLAKLASSKSLFDDPSQEIDELSFVIKQDIKTLQSRVMQMQKSVEEKKKQYSGKDQTDEHAAAIVGNLQHKLFQATTGFKEVLQSRAENMKTQQDRRGQFSMGAPGAPGASAFANPFAAIGEKTPMFDEDGGVEVEDDDECVINVPSMEQIQMVPVNSYAESRAVAVEGIQKTVVELAEIYKSVSLMVQAQHEMVESIDKNVDATVENVESAQEMWSQYLERISSNRVLIMKILSILLAFGLFFIIFLK